MYIGFNVLIVTNQNHKLFYFILFQTFSCSGSGLSSSASLEVAVARFVEAVLGRYAFTSEKQRPNFNPTKERALRCKTAENEWCHSPCGIMDQAIISAATSKRFLLIDCRSLEFTPTKMADESKDPLPVLVVANSNVKHSIGGGMFFLLFIDRFQNIIISFDTNESS